jgi:1,4-dihydroxy-2-naphthoate octaprenyltransferase
MNSVEKISAWAKVLRLQFYPMAFIAYSLGAAALPPASPFNLKVFGLGYAVLFFVELATILTNELNDYQTDSLNKNFSPFNGGSRVLVEGRLGFKEVKTGLLIVFGVIIILSYLLIRITPAGSSLLVLLLVLTGLVLGLGYTAPPLKLSYRGFGELVVGFTHSFYLLLCGYGFQTGVVSAPLPWLLGVPLFFSILAANTLAGIPDYEADRAVLKKSLPVILGPRQAAILAVGFVGLSALLGIGLWYFQIIQGTFSLLILLVVPHGVILLLTLFKLIGSGLYDRTINGLMTLSLSYIIWFGLIPLLSLIGSR